MKITSIIFTMMLGIACDAIAQKIDFNLPNKESQSLEDGYTGWSIGRTKDAATLDVDGVTIKVAPVAGLNNAMMCDWWKDGVTKGAKLVGDALFSIDLNSSNDYSYGSGKSMGIEFKVKGLSAGKHTLTAYHNNTGGSITSLAPIAVKINGSVVKSGIQQTNRQMTESESATSYVSFNVAEGETVTIQYVSQPESGKTYTNTSVAINALIFDRPMPGMTASDPVPAHLDLHYDCDNGSAILSWKASAEAVKHDVYIGLSADNMKKVATVNATTYDAKAQLEQWYASQPAGGLDGVIYWRVDEVTAGGEVYEGDVWTFRPRHLAFPGAEGYGKYAIGGRGGIVYHVTSLDDYYDNSNNADDPNNETPVPGTFRYGIREVKGPRTIVFDVSGYITLKCRLMCSDRFVTIAGQTAPGKGICFRGAPLGVNSDGITRFIRSRRGYAGNASGPIESEQDKGLDGLGSAGGDHTIIDHCSISWTTDEAFSSRGAKNLTLQHTLISEALNVADHPNYSSGTKHGYAATIGGGENSATLTVGSYHHNLLAHCEGRNWSLSGGLDGAGYYDGHHDVFNNVVYNWGGRATDGGTHQLNFVANYYKKGPSTSQNMLLNLQLEGTGKGTQSAYVSGNIREETDGKKTQDKQDTTYKYSTSGGQVVDWTPFVSSPFFESKAIIETAEQAYCNVLSDVGCTMPMMDDHDARIIKETYNRSTTYKGSKSGKKGLIDREWDAEGYETLPEEKRATDYDTDQDGMPDWWENATGGNPLVADNNADADHDGYTALEEYLNWIAVPNFVIADADSKTVDLLPYFAGYSSEAKYVVESGKDASVSGTKLTVGNAEAMQSVRVKCTEASSSLVRTFNFCFASSPTSIHSALKDENDKTAAYNIAGQRTDANQPGIVISNGKKVVRR